MFDENAAAAAGVFPSMAAAGPSAAAALMVALNTASVATAGPSSAPPSGLSGGMPALLQHQQQQQQQQQLAAQLLTGKDSRWLQLDVCREYQRGQCTRLEQDCKYAHPPPHVEVQNGRVTACYDSIKGRCTRENPRCKYLHPPQHLKDQLLANGKQNLMMKSILSQQLSHQQQSAAANTLPALAQIMQPGAGGPLTLQSAGGLPLPFFAAIPGPALFPGALLPAQMADPTAVMFSAALQSTPSSAASLPLAHAGPQVAQAAAVAQQLALLQQQAGQHQHQSAVSVSPANATAIALQQLLAAHQQQSAAQPAAAAAGQQQQLLYLALLQQHHQQQQQQLIALAQAAQQAAAAANSGLGGLAAIGKSSPTSLTPVGSADGGSGRKRSARAAGLDPKKRGERGAELVVSPTGQHGRQQQQQDQILANGIVPKRAKGAQQQGTENGCGTAVNGVTLPAVSSTSGPPTMGGLPAVIAAAGLPLFATAQHPQFNPYLMPAGSFLPTVSFAGQLPPRF